MTRDTAPRKESPLAPHVDPEAQARPVEPGAPSPDLSRTGEAMRSPVGKSVGMTVLAVLATLYTLYFAREFLQPIAYAVLLSFLFSPVVRWLARLHVRPPVGAALVLLLLLGAGSLAVYELAGPVQDWVTRAPTTVQTTQHKLRELLRPLERVSRTAQQVERAASSVSGGTSQPQEVVVRPPTLLARLFGTTQRFLTHALEVLILLYFLLAGGDLFLQKLIKVLPNLHDKRKAVEIARRTESSVSTYLFTAACVNLAEGAAVAGVMFLLGMPNPVLWGALAALLEFIPYLGAVVMTLVLAAAGLTTFDSLGHALAVPAAFLVINVIQGNFVSPMLLGHRLALNPVALFVGLAFWYWIWGIAGAFIAVPMLATFKIFCDHIESLASVGEFLGMRDQGERRAVIR
jgi:predicted PurR-regulated permease PerM